MESENRIYQVKGRDAYETSEGVSEDETNLRGEIGFNPMYEELKQDFSSNPFSARSCRCHPGRG